VEDNEVFREALELLLGLTPEVEVVGAVGDGEQAVATCARLAPDVVLMDYRLPGLDGVQATRAIREAVPRAAVICLTAEVTPRELEALREAGACDCLTKDEQLDHIVTAIRRAADSGGG
jgi:DNA-binding NarL/FixJ family response regulator